MLRHGWRTGAIVPELELETKVVNTEQYAQSLTWLQALTGLLERMQVSGATEKRGVTLQQSYGTCHSLYSLSLSFSLNQMHRDPDSKEVLHEWMQEREELRWVSHFLICL